MIGFDWAQMDPQRSFKKMLMASAVFHVVMAVLLLGLALARSFHPFRFQVYQVDLVSLASAPTPAAEKVAPARPAPPPPKPPVKVAEKKAPEKPKLKKPPAPPPKPIKPVAAIPPPAKPKKEATPPEEAVPETPPPAPAPKAAEESASIPSPAAKIEAGVEVPNFKYPYYLSLIQQKIELHWAPPPLDSASELKETIVAFVLSANGKIGDPQIERSSGNVFFDQAALRAIYQANPLPPFPQGIHDPSLKVHFSFSLMKKS